MWELIGKWLYDNAMAIFISSLASLIISKRYYNKGNRQEVLTTVIYPIVGLLSKRYGKDVYEELFRIKTSHAMRYLHKKERNKLLILVDNYMDISRYSKHGVNTDAIMAYYDYKLKQNGINPKPCLIRDDEGDIVADDYPPDYNYLVEEVYNVVASVEFAESLQMCRDAIIRKFNEYTKMCYTDTKIDFFDDYTVEEVIKHSEVTKEWKDRFEALEKSKKEFLELRISKEALKIVNESNL